MWTCGSGLEIQEWSCGKQLWPVGARTDTPETIKQRGVHHPLLQSELKKLGLSLGTEATGLADMEKLALVEYALSCCKTVLAGGAAMNTVRVAICFLFFIFLRSDVKSWE